MGADLSQLASVDAMSEANRYYGSNGKPIILAETEGHARVVLNQVRKETEQALADKTHSSGPKKCTGQESVGHDNHCPLNDQGPQKVHIQQQNLEDNAYISDIYIGNPPQKIRALFDTGSTNTWVLNKQTPINGEKEYSYDDGASCSAVKLPQRAAIQFGSGALMGHFMTDDVRIGSCDGKSTG